MKRFPGLPLLLSTLLGAAAWAVPFRATLREQGVTFDLTATDEGSIQLLQVRAKRGGTAYRPVKQELIGQVVDAKAKDLNGDGRPELVVMVRSVGSGSYGSVQAWSAGPRKLELIPLMGELTGPDAKGYMGHDSFNVVETSVVRQFPIYRTGDSNARASGGTRQIVYKMVSGPGGWSLQPVRSTDLPPP
jgi:hypothetical protein